MLAGVVLLMPFMLALHQLAQASDVFVRWIGQFQESGVPVPPWVSQLPLTGDLIVNWWQENLSDPKAAAQWLRGVNLESFTAWTRALGGELLHRLMLFFLALIALFFLYRDGGGPVGERARDRRPFPRRPRRAAREQDRRCGAGHRERHGRDRGR